ncbi:MAG: hypothetical protein OSJ68_01670 [Clostridia bacterium]|nr:hypothetical protein [Clostridia bacterium]
MQKMFVRLSDTKIARNGKYSKERIWQMIDEECEKHCLRKVILTDSSRAYYVAPERERLQLRYADILGCCKALSVKDWFASSVEKWINYGNTVNLDQIAMSLNYSTEFKANYYV